MDNEANARPEMLQMQAEQFLFREAEVLDEWNLMGWLDMITPDIDYRIPIRTTRETSQNGEMFSQQSFHMIEDYGSLAARMKRIEGGNAFSESPRSRVRRHISNIRVGNTDNGEMNVRSNLLFFWARDELERLVSAERQDVLRTVEGKLLLARRTVLVDHVSLPLPNLSVVL
jgi:3-phenylpropionate/cinnamic acid dioxygenase small subunit